MRVFLGVASTSLVYGGPAVSVTGLANALATQGCDVTLWTADPQISAKGDGASQGKIHIVGGRVGDVLSALPRPDIIHDNGIWLRHNHQISKQASLLGVSRIVSPRGMLAPWAMRHKGAKKKVAWSLYQRRDLLQADCLHATAAKEAKDLEGLALKRPIMVLANGLSPDALVLAGDNRSPSPKLSSEGKTALFLGRLYPVKGLPLLLWAWGIVRPVGWRLLIAGPDEAGHRRQLEAQIEEMNLGQDVSFCGPVDPERKWNLLKSADLFLLPSLSESFGMALAEAMLAGLPVVTTEAVPWPDVQPAGLGWRVAPTGEAIAQALLLATGSSSDELTKMGERARAYVMSRYMWDSLAPRYIEMYESVLAGRQ